MRKLKTTDVPVLCRCLKKIGLKEKFKKLAEQADTMADVWEQGFDFIWSLFDTITEEHGEGVLYEFLAGPFEMTEQEVRDLDLDQLLDNLEQLVAENDLPRFFKSAARLMR